MTSLRSGPPNVVGSMGFEHGYTAVMHAEHHRGGSALLRDAPYNYDGTGKPKAEAANFR
jgi:hypothetical protein